ncbi:MAG: hypothetical protein WCF26_08365 [Candidatus Sulfotelmatobacter sp.]
MSRRHIIWIAGMLACTLAGAWAQDSSTPPTEAPSQSGQPDQQEPVPAYGQQGSAAINSENPPLSGLDLPSLEPHAAPLSYLQPGATFSESAITNGANSLGGGTNFSSITRGLGSVTLRRLWSNYDLAMDYMGGAGYYKIPGQGWTLLQQMDVEQRINWKRGNLSLRDSFSYLPEGNFGAAYGSLGSTGISSLGETPFSSFFGGAQLGTLGLAPRIMNLSLADISETLTPKSAITAAGGYALTHFYGSDTTVGTSFIGTSQVSAQAGYNRVLTSHTQMALVYGYQAFDFSVYGAAFHSHVIQGMYGHRISGRMDLLLGAGPQLTLIDTQTAVCSNSLIPLLYCTSFGGTLDTAVNKQTLLGVAARGRLRYQLTKTMLDLDYQRFETAGSGIFAGAQTNIIRLSANRPISRAWRGFVDIGYSRNDRLQPLTPEQVMQCAQHQSGAPAAICPANDAASYSYGFAGLGMRRHFGRAFDAFMTYQFNELSFDQSYCVNSSVCNRISNQNVITFGLDWTPRPIRLD